MTQWELGLNLSHISCNDAKNGLFMFIDYCFSFDYCMQTAFRLSVFMKSPADRCVFVRRWSLRRRVAFVQIDTLDDSLLPAWMPLSDYC